MSVAKRNNESGDRVNGWIRNIVCDIKRNPGKIRCGWIKCGISRPQFDMQGVALPIVGELLWALSPY